MKKTNKENPITFFRKANEARQAVVKKSLKKAKDGIEMNDDMINKAGSTGGYKKPVTMASVLNRPVNVPSIESQMSDSIKNNINSANEIANKTVNKNYSPPAIQARTADSITNRPKSNTPVMDSLYPKQKKGGSVYKKGGATKATKFAALAPPYNKATAADRIVGAKKNAKKK